MTISIKTYEKRYENLKSERSSFMDQWMDLSDFHLTNRGRFLTTDRNKGSKSTAINQSQKRINNKSTVALKTLAAGMMSGITSPARPWFALQTSDRELNEIASVKRWLHTVQTRIMAVFSQSNLYNQLHNAYLELGCFGTTAIVILQDYDEAVRFKTLTAGEYCIANNSRDEVDTMYREFEMTVAQVVGEFGYDKCSSNVQTQWDNGNTEAGIVVMHIVEPNDDHDSQSPLARDKKFRSVYFERCKESRRDEKYLRESGFDTFPVAAPRWSLVSGDVYATDCPGMTALGDTKALQLGERRKYQAIDKLVNPPMKASANLRDRIGQGGMRPDKIIYTNNATDSVDSIYGNNYRPDLGAIQLANQDSERRISIAFYEDLFTMMMNTDRRQITAREVAEKQEEKLLLLGPVLERLHNELLDPIIDRTYDILEQAGVFPSPPPEIEGRDLKIEYVSILAQAQRMVAVGGIERTIGFAAEMSAIWPEARLKVKPGQTLDDYSSAMGVNPNMMNTDDEVAEMQAAEQARMQQAQNIEQGQQVADTVKTISETNVANDENALAKLLKQGGMQ